MTPKITIEKSKGQHIGTPITSELIKILTFCKKRWHNNDGIFQKRSTCFFDPGPPFCLNYMKDYEIVSKSCESCSLGHRMHYFRVDKKLLGFDNKFCHNTLIVFSPMKSKRIYCARIMQTHLIVETCLHLPDIRLDEMWQTMYFARLFRPESWLQTTRYDARCSHGVCIIISLHV